MRSENKSDTYAARAKAAWGETDAYREFEKKSAGRSRTAEEALGAGLMEIFGQFGKIKDLGPESAEARNLVKMLRGYITEHYYTCTDAILLGLGEMYAAGGEFTENIDARAGEGTAVFTARAIRVSVQK